MSRGRVKTISEAMRSEGMAMSSRRRTYLRIVRQPRRREPGGAATTILLVDPGGHHPAAVIEAVVRHVVLDVRLPRRDDLGRGVRSEVRVLREVALDVVDDLLALGDIERAALQLDHVGELRIVQVPDVERLPRHE